MNALCRSACTFLAFFAFTLPLAAQKEAPAPPQTARQALLEMIKGGSQGVMKHLTVDVQQLLAKTENSQALAAVGMFGSFKEQASGEMQTFETGPVLLSFDDPRERAKVEVRVENDDLNGEEDTLELSVHMQRDGQEVREELSYFLSHLHINMVRQQNVWRFNKVAVGVELPFGDPEFLKRMFLKPAEAATAAAKSGLDVHTELRTVEPAQPVELPPSQMLNMMALAERTYAGQHPDVGFTCSLPELAEIGKRFMLNGQIATGSSSGFKISLIGCQGKPAGSFQITLEPTSPGSGGKAFCIDATQNIRISDDGRGATCLNSGRPLETPNAEDQEGNGATEFVIGAPGTVSVPKK